MKKGSLLAVVLVLFLALALFAGAAENASGANLLPIASFTYSPSAPMPGDSITFDASASYDPDGKIVSYAWDFGDGLIATVSRSAIKHSYAIDGTYTVGLTVTDSSGAQETASAILRVSTVVFFRVVFYGTLTPLSNVKVTAYYNDTGSWQPAPPGSASFEIRYDNMTQPDPANTPEERFRNPGFTASILYRDASNIGFDVYPSYWFVYFKFEWGSYVAYWPNETTRVYSYKNGVVETHDYHPGHQAVWDPSAYTYAIKVNDIHGGGVSPTESHPIIIGVVSPPPPERYYLTVATEPSGITIPGEGLYNKGTNVMLTAPTYALVTSDSRWRFSYWDVDLVSQGYGVNPITVMMNSNHTATAHYLPQYSVVFDQTGLSADATGTVVTINGSAKSFAMLPNYTWVDNGSSLIYSYGATVSSSIPGKQYGLNSVTGPSSPITITAPVNVTGNYSILGPAKYTVTFRQSGVGPDFTGTVVTVDGTGYNASTLPVSFLWDEGSVHAFSFISPLVVDQSKQYNWYYTTGLTALQSGNLTVTGSGNVTGNYSTGVKYQITFNQTGIKNDFLGTIVIIDGANYTFTGLPVSFWWDADSNHTFAFSSPLVVSPSAKQYVWTSTAGLSTEQSGTLTVTTSGAVIGNYKTQFYLTLSTDPPGVASPSGGGWYDAGTNATISTPAFVDIVSGLSRYRFNGWQTANMSEIADPARSPTSAVMDENKTVTATYVVQYLVTFSQTGISSDFTGTIVTIDGTDFNFTSLPSVFYWDSGTLHNFDFKSPLVVTPNAKRYIWTATTGLSGNRTESMTISSFGNVTGNCITQYYLTIGTVPPGIVAILGEGWYNQSTSVSLTAPAVLNYNFDHWAVNSVSQGAGVNPIMLTMNAPYNAQAYYNTVTPYTLAIITTPGGTTNPLPGTYSYSSGSSVQVTAIPNSGYLLNHWELDGTNISSSNNPYTVTMNTNHTLKAVFSQIPPPPTLSINPMNSSITLGGSVIFTSTVIGGTTPYQYQWYMDGAPVMGAASSGWMCTPQSAGLHFVHLKVTDANSNVVYSGYAEIRVAGRTPVGGYSVSPTKRGYVVQASVYIVLLSLFGLAMIVVKRKRK